MAVIKSRKFWPTVKAGGPDLVLVQLGPHVFQKVRREDAERRGLTPVVSCQLQPVAATGVASSETDPDPEPQVEETEETEKTAGTEGRPKRRPQSRNKARAIPEDKGDEG